MQICRPGDAVPAGAAITIGNFDGLHRAHQQILAELKLRAREKSCPAAMVTFEPSPLIVMHKEFPYILTPLAEKAGYLGEMGIDFMYVIPFDDQLQEMSAEAFLSEKIVRPLRPVWIVVGYDYRFGKGRQGDTRLLAERAARYKFELQVIPELSFDGGPVKSTRIRERLLLGAVRQAGDLLGRRYRVSGRVVHGVEIGRDLGFPTANLQLLSPEKLIPPPGVYAVAVSWNGSRYQGVMNIGFRPTFAGVGQSLEVHIIDFEGDLYGRELTVEFVERLRPETKFLSADDLRDQIAADVALARLILTENNVSP